MSKYAPLSAKLSAHPGDEWSPSFAELEQVLGSPLPKSARQHLAWWGNELKPQQPHKKAWVDQGWRVGSVDPARGRVTFRRNAPLGAAAAGAQPAGTPAALGDEPAIVASLERPKWHAALVAGGLAVVAGVGALAIRSLIRRRSDRT